MRKDYWLNRVAIVTGASSGIGEAVARLLLDKGAQVGLIGRSIERLNRVASSGGTRAFVLPTDVRDRQATRRAVFEVIERWGKVDLLVYSAGVSCVAPVDRLDDEVRNVLDTNLLGALWSAQSVLPSMRRARFGRIVLTSSVSGHIAPAAFSAYAMSKWGLRALAESLRAELAGTGVGVSLVSPFYVQTPMLDLELAAGPLPSYSVKSAIAPESVARAILRAAQSNQREVVLAPWWLRLGLVIGQLFPELLDVALARAGRPLLEEFRRRREVDSSDDTFNGPRLD